MKIKEIIKEVDTSRLLLFSQFTIDLIEEFSESVEEMEEMSVTEETTAGAICYKIDTVLDIMRKDKPDYEFLKALYTKIRENYPL